MTKPIRLGAKRSNARVGGKAAGLEWLIAKNLRTPPAWMILPGFIEGLEAIVQPGKRYAVRSSANVEDGVTASFAGQFLTILDAVGVEGVRKAIDEVRGSINTEAVRSYAARVRDNSLITMPVIVQEMVSPQASGVAFTRNPITGLNEVVLEAVAGRGDRLVSAGVTPQRWVRRWGTWISSPDEPPIPDAVAAEIAKAATGIAAMYGRAVDIEWVWDGSEVWWMQIRPITGIRNIGVYSNQISQDVMPGLIKPLVWSVNAPLANRAWAKTLAELAGKANRRPRDLVRLFAYRSYFNMREVAKFLKAIGLPPDAAELLLGLPEGPEQPSFRPSPRALVRAPRMAGFALNRSRAGKRIRASLGRAEAALAAFEVDLSDRSDNEVLSALDGLMEAAGEVAYVRFIEPLLAAIQSRLFERKPRGGRSPQLGEVEDRTQSVIDHEKRLFREYFLELGRRLEDRGVIAMADDVMYLSLEEVRAGVAGSLDSDDARQIVADHKQELEELADVAVPGVIYGDDYAPAFAASRKGTLHGVATSRGRHRGALKVVSGQDDFAKVETGDILAIRASDVGWTPLFVRVGAVITEAGGMLSNSSIIAREFRLPCVVGVRGITEVEDGTVVTVDGYRGEVLLG